MSEKPLHVLKVDQPMAKPGDVQPEADKATIKLYEDALPSIVRVETANGRGTGFAALKPGLIVTDYHCVGNATEVNVRTSDGKLYKARVKDIDDIKDLAVLEIEGTPPPSLKPLELAPPQKLKKDQLVTALGHPEGQRPVYASPGYFVTDISFENRLFQIKTGRTIQEVMEDPLISPKDKQDQKEVSQRSVIYGRVHIRPGNSGGPLLDEQGRVVGVADLLVENNSVQYYSNSLFTPVSDVHDLLNRETPKFQTKYAYKGEDWTNSYKLGLRENPLLTLGTTGVAGAMGYYGLTTQRKLIAGSFAGGVAAYGGISLFNDGERLLESANSRDHLKYGVAATADASLLAGGILKYTAKPVFTAAPLLTESVAGRGLMALEGAAFKEGALLRQTMGRAGRLGVGLIVAGAAAKIASDFIPNRLIQTDLSRSDGDVRPPLTIWRNP